MTEDTLLEARGVAMSYGRRPVLRGVDLAVRRGELVAVTGENGAGKSTLLGILAGRLRPDAGGARLGGTVGYCPQEPLLFDRLTVPENLAYFGAAYGLAAWREAAAPLLERYRLRADPRLRAEQLSAGTRQKLNVILALLHAPEIVLLDEPYAAFDWDTYQRFWAHALELRAQGRGVLVVAHLVFDRGPFDRICALAEGRLSCA